MIEPGAAWLPMRLENRVFAIVAETDEKYSKFDPDGSKLVK